MLPAGIISLSMVNSQNLSRTGFFYRLSFYDDDMPLFLIRLFPDFELWLYLAPLPVPGANVHTWRH
jgi:hypothetical protein